MRFDVIEVSNDSCKKEWEAIAPLKRGEIEGRVLKLGLSSTGKIKIQNIYRLTKKSKLGNEGDEMAMFIQEDLLGERLFWVALMNLDTKKVQLIYDVQNCHRAEQDTAGQSATAE